MFVFQESLCWSYLGTSHLKQLALDAENDVNSFREKLACGKLDLQGSFHWTDGQRKQFREMDRVRKVSIGCLRIAQDQKG